MLSRRRTLGLAAAGVAGLVAGRISLGLDGLWLTGLTLCGALLLIVVLTPWVLRHPPHEVHMGPDQVPSTAERSSTDKPPLTPEIGKRNAGEFGPAQWDPKTWDDVVAAAAGIRSIDEAPRALTRDADGTLRLRIDAQMMRTLSGQHR